VGRVASDTENGRQQQGRQRAGENLGCHGPTTGRSATGKKINTLIGDEGNDFVSFSF